MKLTYYLILLFALVACAEKDEITPTSLSLPNDQAGLEQLVSSDGTADEKMAAYWELFKLHKSGDQELASKYLLELGELSRKEGHIKYQGKSKHYLGLVAYNEGDYVRAVELYLAAADLFSNLKDPAYQADALNNLGNVFMETGNYDYAIKFLDKARSSYAQVNDLPFLVMVDLNLGISHYSKKEFDYEKAAMHFSDGLENAGALHGRQDYYFNRIYNQIGALKYKQGEYKSAIHNYQLSLEYIENDDRADEKRAIAYANIGESYMDQGNYTEAKRWLSNAFDLINKVENNTTAVDIHNMMAKLYQVQDKHEQAIEYLELAIEKANKDVINESLQETIEMLRPSYKFLQNSGKPVNVARYETAFAIDGQQDAFEKELLENTNFKALQAALGLSIELDNQIKARKAEIDQRETISNIALGLGILLILAAILGFVYTINYRKTKRNRDEWKDVCLEVKDVLESIPQ